MEPSPRSDSRLTAGEESLYAVSPAVGSGTPIPRATCVASSPSTFARCSTVRARAVRAPTLPSSNRNASTMCCFSQSAMLFQNSAGWL